MYLSRFLMWRIAMVSVVILICALILALWQARINIAREEQGAAEAARMFGELDGLQRGPTQDIPAHIDALRRISRGGRLRHLQLRLQDASGNDLILPPATSPHLLQHGYAWLLPPAYRDLPSAPPQWNLQRTDGHRYRATLLLDPASERSESLADIAGLLGILAGYGLLMLLAIYIALRIALQPMREIVHAIDHYRHSRYDYRLPTMRLTELHAIAQALNRMAQALAHSQRARERLNLQLHTTQQDERARLARELHDEFGQRLTAMRADIAWLIRRSVGQVTLHNVASTLAENCEHIQHAIRDLLHRLRSHRANNGEESPLPLHHLLQELVASWREHPDQQTQFVLQTTVEDSALSNDIALTVYRLTQEALTNIAKHAEAGIVRIVLKQLDDGRVEWTVCDDGKGMVEVEQTSHPGNGLAGMRERVWALHGELDLFAAHPNMHRPGLCLCARIPMEVTRPPIRNDVPRPAGS